MLWSENFWADVGGSSPDPTCIVGGDGADRGELAGGGMKTMGATTAGAAVPVLEAGPRPEATLGLGSRGFFGTRYNSWVGDCFFSDDGLMAGPAGQRRVRSGEAEMGSLGVGRSGPVAQVGTLRPEKLQENLPEGEGTPTADGGSADLGKRWYGTLWDQCGRLCTTADQPPPAEKSLNQEYGLNSS